MIKRNTTYKEHKKKHKNMMSSKGTEKLCLNTTSSFSPPIQASSIHSKKVSMTSEYIPASEFLYSTVWC